MRSVILEQEFVMPKTIIQNVGLDVPLIIVIVIALIRFAAAILLVKVNLAILDGALQIFQKQNAMPVVGYTGKTLTDVIAQEITVALLIVYINVLKDVLVIYAVAEFVKRQAVCRGMTVEVIQMDVLAKNG